MIGISRCLIRKSRAWPHQRHITEKDIDKLRQLVDRPAPQMRPYGGHTRIPAEFEENPVRVITREQLGSALLSVNHHGAEFVNPENAAVLADPYLREQRRPAIGEPDRHAEGCKHRGEQDQYHRSRASIEQAP